jgi:hypothetical protein
MRVKGDCNFELYLQFNKKYIVGASGHNSGVMCI